MVQGLDICIRGGGIVGRTLALLLARERLRVGLVMPMAPAQASSDVRAYALNQASRTLLESLRCWPSGHAVTPVRHMTIEAERGGRLDFDANALATEALGWIVDVPVLEMSLAEAVRYQPQIEILESPAAACLQVICEGRASRTREELGVEFDILPYGQQALAARVRCAQKHGQTAHQWFSNGDILAFLPLGGADGDTMAIVWSVGVERAAQLQNASTEEFCRQLHASSGNHFGALELISERASWPLQRAQATRWSGRHQGQAWVLAGDAAHTVHPLAGQGLNLGLADVCELARQIQQRDYWRGVDDAQLLRRYERTRKAGMLALDLGMDGLQLLFAREGEQWSLLRNRGLDGVQALDTLKNWLARRAMG